MNNRYFKTTLAFLISMLLIFATPMASLAHGGRTDSSGGHKDNQNASGLGYYHYHHGMGPHLHPNGVCPYATQALPKTEATPTNMPISNSVAPSADQKTLTVNIGVTIDGKTVEFTESSGFPFADTANRTQVPFRQTMEAFGCSVSWNSDTKTALAEKDGITVKVPVGLSYIYKNDVKILTDSAAQSRNNRIYLPIRAVLEAFGASVNWDSISKNVVVTTKPNSL